MATGASRLRDFKAPWMTDGSPRREQRAQVEHLLLQVDLWKSKRRMETASKAAGYSGPVILTPLNTLEPQAEKHLGPRPPGLPFGTWLMRLRSYLSDSGALEEAVELHQRLRFDPEPPQQPQRERLAELARQLESAIRHGR